MNFSSLGLAFSLVVGGLLPLAPAQAQTRPPIEAFFENPTFRAARLSPDARLLAVKIGAPGKRDALVVIKLADMSVTPVASYADVDIRQFEWVNNERLVFDTTDKQADRGDVRYAPGLFSVRHDGKEMRQLVNSSSDSGVFAIRSKLERELLPWHTYLTSQRGAQQSDEIYVENWSFRDASNSHSISLLALNTTNGKSRSVAGPAALVQHWIFDHAGEPRLAISRNQGMEAIHYREPDGSWRVLTTQKTYAESEGHMTPLGFGPDGTLYVNARIRGDKAALHAYDLKRNEVRPEPLVTLKDFDFDGELISSHDKLLGVHFEADAESTVWFDAPMKALQAEVDAKLPQSINTLEVGARAVPPWVLVKSHSDVMPATFLLYNSDDKTLSRIGASHAAIQPEQMSRRQFVHYKARDGLDIPAWLTLPKGAGKNLPMVLLVHGGPFSRARSWEWDADSQFLASRGYAVLEPEFRGSTGFGAAHFRAGWKQWGLKMQDDLADGARWAIARGTVDPKRICIAGASYGGYATLMGLINDADLYKCGIDWVGVTDINLMYTGNWRFDSDLPEQWRKFGMPELIGDPVKDAAQLKATSPLEQASRIKQPLLLAYGGLDKRVPIVHGNKFRDAVTKTNQNVEWVEYPEEGHGWARPHNRIDFWRRVEKFLERQIGN